MINNVNNMENNSIIRPMSVAAISIYCWFFSAAFGIFGLFSIVDVIYGNTTKIGNFFFSPLIIVIAAIGLSILYFSTGTGLWQLKKWSRCAAIIISSLMILTNLVIYAISITNNQSTELTIGILHGIAVISLFSTKAKLAFKSS